MDIGNCPNCGETGATIKRAHIDAGNRYYAKCKSCGYILYNASKNDLIAEWCRSKEDMLQYAIQALEKYGNAFISKNTQRLWENQDIAEYLSVQICMPIKIRKCNYMATGCVAEINRTAMKKIQQTS